MMSVWSHRPQFLNLGLFFAAYVLGCGFAQALAIVPGITVSIWPPGGVFIATLILTSPYSWPWWILAGCLAEMFAQFVWFHSPLPAGFLIYVGNALGAAVGATLVNRACGRPVRLETLQEVLAFVVLGAGAAPLVSATVGSATLAWFGVESQTFTAVWPLFWIGDATGILLVAPPALVVIQYWRSKTQLSPAQRLEAGVLGLIFLGVAALSLSDVYLPTPYIILPPLLWAAARFEFRGAAVALTLLALITMALTISGDSQFVGDPESQRERQVMLQLFLAISASSALIVAAISRQHLEALLTLRERERELSLLVEMNPAHIARMGPDGEPTFFSKRTADYIGLKDVASWDKPGTSRLAAMIGAAVHPDDGPKMREALRHSLATGEPYTIRYRLRRADGVYRWREGRAEPLRDQSGAVVQWYAATIDIDDEVRAQEALRESERSLRELVETLPARIWCTTPGGEPFYFSKQLREFYGFNMDAKDEPDNSRLSSILASVIHPDDLELVKTPFAQSLATGEPFVARHRELRFDGVYRWVQTHATAMRDGDGKIVRWNGVNFDVDDMVRAQEALRNRERELSQLVDMVPSYLWRLSPEGEPNFFNKRLIDFFGLDIADADKSDTSRLAAIIETVTHPDDAAGVAEALNRSIATGERFSMRYRLRRADGVYRWVDGSAEPLRDESGRIVQWYGLSHDVDDQVHAEEALRQRERELAQLVDVVPVAISRLAPDGEPTFFNKVLSDFLGLDVAETDKPGVSRLAAAIAAVIHPDDATAFGDELSRCLVTGESFSRQYRLRRADGVYRWMEGRAEPLRGEGGAIVQWYAVAIDIDDEVRAQQALRQSERDLQQVIDTVPVLIFLATPAGDPIYVNKRLADFHGFQQEEFDAPGETRMDRAVRMLVHPDDMPTVHETLKQSFSRGEPFAMRYRQRRHDGVYRWIEGRAEPLRNEIGEIVRWYGVNLDVDDEVRAQEALRQASDKLARAAQAASLAELSASIAHEVNQPLAAIVANSNACHRWLSAEPPNVERAKITAERIIRDANSAADVVSRIRALFRQSVESKNSTTLPGIIAEARNLIAEEAVRRRVRVDADLENNLPPVALDRVQIQQVLINLIRNGMDAMESVTGDRVLGMRVRRIGDVVQTEISDRGPGVEFPDRIFEPFFTTKEHGMGMGLAICRSIVESHGGRLWAEMNEPHGATFVFTLPVEAKATA